MQLNIGRDLIEEFIWMSYRYCIGRHTIAANMHADEIYKLLSKNPDILSKEQAEFMATDIRRQINNILNFKQNIQISCSDDYDIFSELLYYISVNNINPLKVKFFIDYYDGKVNISTEELTEPLDEYANITNEYMDLVKWVALSNWLDYKTHKVIVYDDNGEEKESEVFPYPSCDRLGNYEEAWVPVDSNFLEYYINKKYIKEFKNVE